MRAEVRKLRTRFHGAGQHLPDRIESFVRRRSEMNEQAGRHHAAPTYAGKAVEGDTVATVKNLLRLVPDCLPMQLLIGCRGLKIRDGKTDRADADQVRGICDIVVGDRVEFHILYQSDKYLHIVRGESRHFSFQRLFIQA